jgi:hypothetical protein
VPRRPPPPPEHPPQARNVAWEALSERSQATLRVCWAPLLLGYKPTEIAASVGVSPMALADALSQLREELQA